MESIILFSVIAVAIFGTLVAIVSRYKRCPSDKLLVVYGKTKGGTAQVYHGGGTFIWPVIQDYAFLDLKPMSIDIDLRGALTSQNIRIDVPSTFTVAITSDPTTMKNAAERLLGMDKQSISMLAKDLILGQLRLVIATMTVEEINSDRDKFLTGIQENLENELTKIGLHLVNVNITDIHDESGYIQALGKEAAAKAINDAKVSVAQKNRDGDIGQAEANKEQRIKTSELHSAAEVGEAEARANAEIGAKDAEARQRARTAELNASAVEGENIAAINIAKTTSERQVAEAESNRKAITAQKVSSAQALADSYDAERQAEEKRAEKEEASLKASVIVPSQIQKEKIEIEAAAEANKQRELAKGEADAIYAKMEAEARGDYARLSEQAKGIKELVDAAGGANEAIALMVADKLESLYKIRVEAIKNIKIDKITVWDQGNGANGKNSTAGFLDGMLKSVPGFEEVFNMAGSELPSLLQGAGTKVTKELEAHAKSKQISGNQIETNEANDSVDTDVL